MDVVRYTITTAGRNDESSRDDSYSIIATCQPLQDHSILEPIDFVTR